MDTTCDDVPLSNVAVVIIARNEGERLRQCLKSVSGRTRMVVYVDSGSTDDSVEFAGQAGAKVVPLDPKIPFTAARARNAGFAALGQFRGDVDFVQFVDGDCTVEHGWLEAAHDFLTSTPEAAGVFGRRRERFPDATIYNRLCDEEWDVAPGVAKTFGGDAMVRATAFEQVGGYRDDLIAGEEPELCVRLRRCGWKIVCIAKPMTIHDAAIARFSQWWRRMLRGGYAFAEGAHMHGAPPERLKVGEARRAWFWGAGIPVAIVVATLAFGSLGLLLAIVYPLQILRLYLRRRHSSKAPLSAAFFLVIGKFPEAIGQVTFHAHRFRGKTASIIEYK